MFSVLQYFIKQNSDNELELFFLFDFKHCCVDMDTCAHIY